MIKRTIEISREAYHLSIRHRQLILKQEGKQVAQIPCEDIGVVVIDQQRTTYSHASLVTLARSGATIILCGDDHLPEAIVQPIGHHTEVVWRIQSQLNVTTPVKKRLWQQLVREKVVRQGHNIDPSIPAHKKLLALAKEVRSGDPSNIEAQAAKIYWRNWLASPDAGILDTESFRRDPNGSGINCLLNYGYAVLRASLGRAIVAAGLQPSLGLHHAGRSNLFCLADDLIEPFRPLVDWQVRELASQGYLEIDREAKTRLLDLLVHESSLSISGDQATGPLMVMLHRMIASLIRCYEGESKKLDIPHYSVTQFQEGYLGYQEQTQCKLQDTE